MTALFSRVRVTVEERVVGAAVAVVLSALFAALIMTNGIPALRQDWVWPASSVQVHRFLVDTWSGWSVDGIGAAAPYPSSYLLAVPLYALLLIIGPTATLWVFLLCIGLTVTFGARALLSRAGAAGAHGIVAFALFNPWVYTEVVAGHVIMVLAYGATMFLLALLLSPKIRWKHVLAALVVIFGQLQFFLIGMVLTLLRMRDRDAAKAWLYGVLIFLPTIVGVIAAWRSLSATPYTLTWQQSQSIAPADAALLIGYFAGYTEHIKPFAQLSTGCAIAAALGGLWVVRNAVPRMWREAAIVALCAIAAALLAMGTKGPLAAPYAFAVERFPFTGLFRELFNLLGYVAIGYVALAAYGARTRFVAAAGALAGAAAILCWFIAPPATFFVPNAALPKLSFEAATNTRYALYPAFQPMTYDGRGFGLDPDAYVHAGNVTPVNTSVFQYPSSIALLRYQLTRSDKMLADLSVSAIASRPWLRSSDVSLRDQFGAGAPAEQPSEAVRQIAYLPELSLADAPRVTAFAVDLGSNAVFFGDDGVAALARTSDIPHFSSFAVPNATIDAAKDWVDARLTFLAHPAAAQGFGGVATSSSRVLRVSGNRSLLAYADGKLLVNGVEIASHSKTYQWTPLLPGGEVSLKCSGFCVIAGAAVAVPRLPETAMPPHFAPVNFTAIFPWLVTATLPPESDVKTLRYNVRYDRRWFAFADGLRVPHLELVHTFNGWLIQPAPRPRPLVLIESVAALQTLFELVGSCVVAALVIGAAVHRLRGRSS
jgi:hypothetical protein